MTVLSPLFHVMFVPLLNSCVSCLVSPEHPSHRVTRGSCAGICEETIAYGSVLVVALMAGSGRGLCRVSRLTNPGGASWGRQLMGSRFAGVVWARQRWGHLKEKLYPKNGTCFPESTTERPPQHWVASKQGGIQTSLSPHHMGAERRCGKLGDRMLTAFPGGLLTARGAGEVFPLLMQVGKPSACVAGSKSWVTPQRERGCPFHWHGGML